jgi:hypothetical protein
MRAEPSAVVRSQRIEIASAVVLALATVLTAWCVYQSTRWTGIMATAFSEANANRSESVRLDTQAGSVAAVDVQSFLAWISAVRDGDGASAAAIRARFRSEFAVAFDAWLGRPPETTLTLADLPPDTPLSRPEYRPALAAQSQALASAAEARFADARRANQTGDNYVLVTVLMSIALFLSGTVTRFESERVRSLVVATAVTALAIGLLAVVVLPISFGI